MAGKVDYDRVAADFDRRYEGPTYAGIEAALIDLVAPGDVALEVGCGTGHWIHALTQQGRSVFGVEPSPEMIRRAGERDAAGVLALGCAEALPFADASFDRVFVVNAIHHFADGARFAREARRVLRPAGKLVVMGLAPSMGCDPWFIYEYFPRTVELDRARYPSPERIGAWFDDAGFSDCSTTVVDRLVVKLPARSSLEDGLLTKEVTSQLSLLTDAEYDDGIARIWRAIEEAEVSGDELFLESDLRIWATSGVAARAV